MARPPSIKSIQLPKHWRTHQRIHRDWKLDGDCMIANHSSGTVQVKIIEREHGIEIGDRLKGRFTDRLRAELYEAAQAWFRHWNPDAPARKKRGRPKGSKNKPKVVA